MPSPNQPEIITPRISDQAIRFLECRKIHQPGQLAAATPFSLAHDAAIETAIVGIKAGRTVADVTKAAVNQLKARLPEVSAKDLARLERDIWEAVKRVPAMPIPGPSTASNQYIEPSRGTAAMAAKPMQKAEFRTCPFCKEQIRATAVKCRFCGEWIESPLATPEAPTGEIRAEKSVSEPAALSMALPPFIRVEMPKVAETAHNSAMPSVVSPEQPNRSNYLIRHWRGELSLGISYWVNSLLSSLLLAVLTVVVLSTAVLLNVSLRFMAALYFLGLFVDLVVFVWLIVGIWRSATKHVYWFGGLTIWAVLAKLFVILGVLQLAVMTKTILSSSGDYWSVLCGEDKSYPSYKVRVLFGGAEIEFRGGLRAGSAAELERVLKATPRANVLRINSMGGRIREAKEMERLVRARGMSTYTTEECAGAATWVFISGKERVLARGARLGFQEGIDRSLSVEQQASVDNLVRQKMLSVGISETFINRALTTENGKMWYPSVEEMRSAGVITAAAE